MEAAGIEPASGSGRSVATTCLSRVCFSIVRRPRAGSVRRDPDWNFASPRSGAWFGYPAGWRPTPTPQEKAGRAWPSI